MNDFIVAPVHKWWAESRAKRWGLRYSYVLGLLKAQDGLCALSSVPLVFGDGNQHHPLFGELDHRAPGSDDAGHQVICRALNAAKGSLPLFLFEALTATITWQEFIAAWQRQASVDRDDFAAFERLLNPTHHSPLQTTNTEARPVMA